MAQAKSLTQTEITTILTHIEANTNAKRNRMMFLIGLTCGLRVSEIAGLTIGDVRNKDETVKLQSFYQQIV